MGLFSGSSPAHLPCLPQCAKITLDYQRRLSSRTAPGRTKHATMRKAIAEFLRTSYTCLLLVSPEIRRLEHAADELLPVYPWPRLSLGQELSPVLLPVIPQRRSREARRWMRTRSDELSPGPVLCTEIDLLFEPALELDPLRLLCDIGRVARLIVTWPGSYLHDVLAYAVPDHSHYRTWRNPEVYVTLLE
jgi:hypothetical protein